MGFRIQLYLHNFFADYRSSTRLFISKAIKTIDDLHKHITNIFDINSKFYLICDGFYLPDSENIRVLEDNDTVIAIPHFDENWIHSININTLSSLSMMKASENLFSSNSKIKRKRKRHIELEEETLIKNDLNTNAKQKSKIPIEPSEQTNNVKLLKDADLPILKELKKCNSAEKQVKSIKESFDNNILPESTECEVDFKPNKVQKHTKKLNIIRQKLVELLPISTTPKVIKSIRVNDNTTNLQENELRVSMGCPKNEMLFNSHPQTSSKDSITGSEQNENYDETETFGDTSTEVSDVQKRKRKRVRKRKDKNLNEVSKINFTNCVNNVPMIVNSAPQMHIRFDDNENKTEDVPKSKVNYEKLCLEEIVTFPLMKDVFPKEKDVIAFKIYILSPNYTPEISNYIIGQVKMFSSDTHKVAFTLLEGKEQCRTPEGKFFIEENSNDNLDELECKWYDLFEPRLLFP